jgi:hypothetical protein
MRISNNNSNYDSVVNRSSSTQRVKTSNTIRSFFEAFRVDFSQRALLSKEFNNPNIKFPTHNEDVLQYSEKLNLIFK